MDLRFKDRFVPDFMDGIPDFMEKFNQFIIWYTGYIEVHWWHPKLNPLKCFEVFNACLLTVGLPKSVEITLIQSSGSKNYLLSKHPVSGSLGLMAKTFKPEPK